MVHVIIPATLEVRYYVTDCFVKLVLSVYYLNICKQTLMLLLRHMDQDHAVCFMVGDGITMVSFNQDMELAVTRYI